MLGTGEIAHDLPAQLAGVAAAVGAGMQHDAAVTMALSLDEDAAAIWLAACASVGIACQPASHTQTSTFVCHSVTPGIPHDWLSVSW